MRWYRLWLVMLALTALAWGQPRTLYLSAPIPQGKFPPPWTETIHISIEDASVPIQDHRHLSKGAKEFRSALSGPLGNQVYQVEVLCLSKGEKQIAVFRQSIRVKPGMKKLRLDRLQFVELLKT